MSSRPRTGVHDLTAVPEPTTVGGPAASQAVLVVGGPAPDALPAGLRDALARRSGPVVAVDSGLHLALELRDRGWLDRVELVVGDLDSVDPDRLAIAGRDGTEVQTHPVDKDATDLELALDHLVGLGVSDTLVVAGAAGRLDHLLGGALVLGAPRYSSLGIDAWLGGTRLVPIHDRATLAGAPGATVSLLAAHGTARGVRTSGLRWELRGEDLPAGAGRGISNEFAAEQAEISVEHGPLTAVVPQEEP